MKCKLCVITSNDKQGMIFHIEMVHKTVFKEWLIE
jgi:hypothetical protein